MQKLKKPRKLALPRANTKNIYTYICIVAQTEVFENGE